jgi:hypothetical protein
MTPEDFRVYARNGWEFFFRGAYGQLRSKEYESFNTRSNLISVQEILSQRASLLS